MLVKKALKEIPPCECPAFDKKEFKKIEFSVATKICEVERCGKIFVADYYSIKSKTLQVRFFSDGKNYIILSDDAWSKKSICDDIREAVSSDGDIQTAKNFFGFNEKWRGDTFYTCRYGRTEGVLGVCQEFVSNVRREEANKALTRKYDRMKRHLKMFSDFLGAEVNGFCRERVFEHTYVFFGNINGKRQRMCTCGTCGKKFRLKSDTVKSGAETVCPKCGRPATFCALRYAASSKRKEKQIICLPYKVDNQLLLEWTEVERWFSENGDPLFYFDTFARTLYLNENGKQKIQSYGTRNFGYNNGFWCDWGKTPVQRKAYVFSKNIPEIFGKAYYGVDLKKVVDSADRPLDFVRLLDNLKNFRQCEYLCKLGLSAFASELWNDDINLNGKSFSEAFSVPGHYLDLYRKCNVTAEEHRAFRSSTENMTPEKVESYRTFIKECEFPESSGRIASLWRYMTIDKMILYCRKQAKLTDSSVGQTAIWLDDYLSMSEQMKIAITKSYKFPKNLRKSHDQLVDQINRIRAENEDKACAEALAYVNKFFNGYEKDGYCILVPQKRSDFLKEGAELSHCVGSNENYFKNHIKGNRMIFFVRETCNPEKAFVTVEVDMVMNRVLQCYGFSDKRPGPNVIKFVNGFVKWLSQAKHAYKEAV